MRTCRHVSHIWPAGRRPVSIGDRRRTLPYDHAAAPITGGRCYSFAEARFEAVCAHGGEMNILTARAEERLGFSNFVALTVVPPGATLGLHTHAPDEEEKIGREQGRERVCQEG